MKNFLKSNDVVYCDDCGVVIKKGCSFDVRTERYEFFNEPIIKELNYCHFHKKPYKLIRSFSGRSKYYNETQVDENGKPIK